jgi:hypothetical protein
VTGHGGNDDSNPVPLQMSKTAAKANALPPIGFIGGGQMSTALIHGTL